MIRRWWDRFVCRAMLRDYARQDAQRTAKATEEKGSDAP